MIKVLIVDDDKDMCEIIKRNVEYEGYEAIVLYSAAKVIETLENNKEIALVILDVILPDDNGFQVLEKIKEKFRVPVFMLTSLRTDIDRIKGLRRGAVDYINKPFHCEEFRARITSIIRQMQCNNLENITEQIILDNIIIDLEQKHVYFFENILPLTATEYRIIELLVRHKGKILTQQQIYEAVTNGFALIEENSITVQICHIRKKFKNFDKQFDKIETVYGLGYRWKK